MTATTVTAIKLLTTLYLNLSHLGETKFKHSFQDFHNAICTRGYETETTTHYLLHHANERTTYRINSGTSTLVLKMTPLKSKILVLKKSLPMILQKLKFQLQQLTILSLSKSLRVPFSSVVKYDRSM